MTDTPRPGPSTPDDATALSFDTAHRMLAEHAPWLLPPEPAAANRLLMRAALRRLPRHQLLLRDTQPAWHLHVLIEGRLHERRPHPQRPLLLQVLRPGDPVAETDVLAGPGTPAGAEYLATQACLLLQLHADDLFMAMDRSAALRMTLLQRQTTRVRRANAWVRQMAMGTVRERLAWLVADARQRGAHLRQQGLTRMELTGLAGVTREATSRALGRLVAEGTLDGSGRFVVEACADAAATARPLRTVPARAPSVPAHRLAEPVLDDEDGFDAPLPRAAPEPRTRRSALAAPLPA